MQPTLVPVLLGLDLNAYSMAISFYESFGVTSHAFGRYRCGITEHSRFVKTHIVPALSERETAVAALLSFARAHKDAYLVLVPCADRYVELAEDVRDRLSPFFHFFLPREEVFRTVSDKASFYALCDGFGIRHPPTHRIRSAKELSALGEDEARYPAVLKPSDTNAYYRHPFVGMKKVYFPKDRTEALAVATAVFASGYRGTLLLQPYIGEGRAVAKTLTVCVDRHSRVCAAVLARAVLEERAPTARGNYSALLTEPLDGFCRSLCCMLTDVGYTGIANLDLLYDADGTPYVLELNARQGRSCDHVRAAGVHLAAFLYAQMTGGVSAVRLQYPTVYWRCVSDRCVRLFAPREEDVLQCMQRRAHGFAFSPFSYEADLRFNPVRRLYVALHALRRAHAFRTAEGGTV